MGVLFYYSGYRRDVFDVFVVFENWKVMIKFVVVEIDDSFFYFINVFMFDFVWEFGDLVEVVRFVLREDEVLVKVILEFNCDVFEC